MRIFGNWFGVKPDEIVVKEKFFFGTGETAVFFGSTKLRRDHGGILPQEMGKCYFLYQFDSRRFGS